ncbi:MAG: hypothetical protein U1F33_07095 [Alphaproteobacteria bacterium]|mgnify:CR=1 FL=1
MIASGMNRRFHGVMALMIVFAVSSCVLYRPDRSYAGIPLKDVIANSGQPNDVSALADGRKVARYDWKDANASPGQPRFCTVEFIVDAKDVIESQTVSGNDCTALRTKLRL